MIENVVILLLSNIFIPMLPLSPLILLPVPLIQFPIEESSVFHKM